MKVVLKNIQSIKDGEYPFDDVGMYQICGGNSNGKSILFRAISAVVTKGMEDKHKRDPLIRDGCESGAICMMHKGKALTALLHRDRNKCAVQLIRADGTEVTRTFRDGGIEELIHEFGFRCYNKNNLCLQLYETFGPMPFVNTSEEVNGEIVEDYTEDITAKRFLQSFKEHTHPKAVAQMKQYNKQIESLERLKSSIVVFDHKEYNKFIVELSNYHKILRNAVIVDLPKLNMPPIVKTLPDLNCKINKLNMLPRADFINLNPVSLRKVILPVNIDNVQLSNISQVINDMNTLLDKKCPTCGRNFVERS